MAALSQNDEQGGQEIMVDHAGDEFGLSQETEITLTQALQEPDKTQKHHRSSSSRPSGANNDDRSKNNRHLAAKTPSAIGGHGGMNGRGGAHHHTSTPSNQKRQQIQQQQNIQLSQMNNHRINPNQSQRPMLGNNHRKFTTTPVARSARLLTSSKSVSSRNNGLLSQSMHEEDDTSTIQSRSFLTQDSQGKGSRFGGTNQQQQQSTRSKFITSGLQQLQQQQQQQQQQRPTMAMTANATYQRIPSLSSSRSRPVSTAVRTISTTLATLATPSKAFHSVTSFAARTAARTSATLGLTPSNFRPRSAVLSTRLTSSGATGTGVQSLLSKSVTGTANSILVKRPEEEEEADDASKVTQKTYDPANEKDGVTSVHPREEERAAAANNEKEKVDDFLSKVQTAMDDKMKQFDDKLNQVFAEKKQELEEFFERTTNTFKESVSKIEGIQEAMDAFPTKVASSTQEYEVQLRRLVGESKEEIEKESLRVVEAISSNARAVADDEAKKSVSEVMASVITTAKIEFQVWTDGVLAGMRSNRVGYSRPVVAVSGEESSNNVGAYDDIDEKKHCQTVVVNGQGVVQSISDKESEQLDTDQETTPSEEVDVTETKSSTVETQTYDDNQCGTDENEEVSKKGATPFSSKVLSHYGSGMSTTTTPFSRKTTPLKNNYGTNRKSVWSSRMAHDAPPSPQIPMKLSSSKKKRGSSPLSPLNDNRKAKSAKKAPKSESKHNYNIEDKKSPNQHISPMYSQSIEEDQYTDKSTKVNAKQKNSEELGYRDDKLAIEQNYSKKTDTPLLSHSEKKQSEIAQQISQRSEKKRDQSALDVEKSTRRSKRMKESNRAEKATLKTRAEQALLRTQNKKKKAFKAKQVTPLDNGARQRQNISAKKDPNNTLSSFHRTSSSENGNEENLDAELHTYPKNDDDEDELLGTSVFVAKTSGGGDDSSGLGPSEGLDEVPKAKLFLPFQNRKKSKKSYAGKSKTAVAMNTGKVKKKQAESEFSYNW